MSRLSKEDKDTGKEGRAKKISAKQTEVISAFKNGGFKRINIIEGSVRSGKTWITILIWALYVASMPMDGAFIMIAKTLTSLRRNNLDLLERIVGAKNFTYSMSKKEGRLFGRIVYFEGASDTRAESKIRGLTLSGAYCDELTLFPEDFFTMLLSRLSVKNSKLIGTTNPDNPNHWLKTGYLDRADEIDLMSVRFFIEDNIFLDPDYISSLKKEYKGVFYERYILGEWKMAEGLVYSMFKTEYIVSEAGVPPIRRYTAGIDYGQSNATVFLLAGEGVDGRIYVLDEYYHSGKNGDTCKSPLVYANDFLRWVKGYFRKRDMPVTLETIYYDPSALGFKLQLTEIGVKGLRKANNEVVGGIQLVSSMYEADLIRICDRCRYFLKEIYAYSWSGRRALAGEDSPVKENDHAMDAFRYICMGELNYWKRRIGETFQER